MGGTWAPRPSSGPHKRRECLPLVVLLRNRLRYALNFREATLIVKEKHGQVMVDGKIRKDVKYPTGFMDVISLPQTKEHFRLLYDTKGRFQVLRIDEAEAKFKLCKVKNRIVGPNHVPYIITHDGRTFRYPHPDIKINDSIKLELGTGEISDFIKMEMGNLVMVTGGKNTGRVGTLSYLERHEGGFDIVHIKDAHGNMFATRLTYAFVIGKGRKPAVSLPKGDGVKKSILEEQAEFIKKHAE